MNGRRTRLVGVALALAVATSLLTVASVAPTSAAEQSFVIEQGDRCVPVTPLSGSEDAEEFYDYRNPENSDGEGRYSYSSYMPHHLQAAETSRLFLYDGPDGVSLVMVHNERDAGRGDSAATFSFSGLPSSGEWAVVDDDYSGQDDRFSRTRIDWTWMGTRNDGGVFRGIDRADLDLTITPRWNEDAALYDSPEQRSGRIEQWQVLSGSLSDPQVTTLPSMSDPVTIRAGTCGDDGGSGDESPPNADLSVSPSEPAVGDSVTFDARDSNDENGIVEYRWDFDGDGSTDDTTSSYRVTHAYESAGTYDAGVTVADAAGNTATANASVTVGDDTPLEAVAEIPENATVGDEVTVDGSASTGDIAEYSWDFDDGAMANGPTPSPHAYTQAGTYDVTLTVTDADGDTDSVTREIVVNEAEDTTTPENETTTPDDGEETTTPDDGNETTAPGDGNETTVPENDTTTPDDPATETPESTPEETTDEPDEQSNSGGTSYNSGASYSAGTDDDEPTPTPEPPEMSVSLNRSGVDAVDASVRHAKAGETATIDLSGNGSNVESTYRSLDVSFARNGSYDLALRTSDSPDGVSALSVGTDGATPFAYLNVSHPDVDDANVSNANVTFGVSEERLAAANASADDVALYRHHGGEWTELDVRQVEGSNGTHVFAAESPGLSTFAVGAKRPSIAVADVTLSDSTVESGGTVTVTAKVTNDGGAAGSYTVDLTAFGEVVDSRDLTLDAGESRSVTFVQRMSSPGAYDLSVNGENATLQVTGSTATETSDGTSTTNGSGQPGFGVTAALVAVLATLVATLRRRD